MYDRTLQLFLMLNSEKKRFDKLMTGKMPTVLKGCSDKIDRPNKECEAPSNGSFGRNGAPFRGNKTSATSRPDCLVAICI